MDRIRPLDPPHKGLRNALGQLSLALGTTDISAPAELEALTALADEVATILIDHARQEDAYIFAPAERFAPGSTVTDREQHGALHDALESINERIGGLRTDSPTSALRTIAADFARFHAAYLTHMAHEEHVLEPILIDHQTDEEMIADQGVIMQTVPFPTLLLWFKYIVPARTIHENRAVLSAFRAAAPAEAFDSVRDTLATVLPAERLHALLVDL